MDELELLVNLHLPQRRQGPGGPAQTTRAIELAGIASRPNLKVADIGCGTGASTLQLARQLDTQVTAVDFLPAFIEELKVRAAAENLAGKINSLCCSMDDLPFAPEEYDVLWAEGAIYNMGFEKGLQYWHQFLKPGGMLVVSEITWTSASRPDELQQFWDEAYPGIDTAGAKFDILERSGYSPRGYFVLPEECWLSNYYRPLQASFAEFLSRNNNSQAARDLIAAEEQEIALYEQFKSFYSYGVYVASRL